MKRKTKYSAVVARNEAIDEAIQQVAATIPTGVVVRSHDLASEVSNYLGFLIGRNRIGRVLLAMGFRVARADGGVVGFVRGELRRPVQHWRSCPTNCPCVCHD